MSATTTPTSNTEAANVTLRITLKDSALAEYEKRAQLTNRTVESVCAEQLWRYKDAASTKPIILDDACRQHLDKLLGRNFTTGDEIVSAVQRALTVRVDEVEVSLSPYLLDRLKTRCIGVAFPEFVKRTITKLIKDFVGAL